MPSSGGHTPEESIQRLEHERNVDREALVLQLRALGSAIEHLCRAVEAAGGGDTDPAVTEHVQEARWALKDVW
jgi:hypothetical protein